MMLMMPRMALILIVGVLTVWAGKAQEVAGDSTADQNTGLADNNPDPWLSPEVAAPKMDDGEIIKRSQVTRNCVSQGEAKGGLAPWMRTTASLAGVVALIILLAWGYRLGISNSSRLSFGRRVRHPGLIEVVSRASLAPRQSVYLVRVGPQLVLVGATHDSLRTLSVIDDPDLAARLAGQAAQRRGESHTAEFQRCLDNETRAYGNDGQSDQADASEATRINTVKQKLSQTMRRLQNAAGSA